MKSDILLASKAEDWKSVDVMLEINNEYNANAIWGPPEKNWWNVFCRIDEGGR